MKKNKFKSWLIRFLNNILNILEPERKNTFKVEHVYVPLVTLNASITVHDKHTPYAHIEEFLAKRLGEQLIPYINIQTCEFNDFNFDYQTTYRATIRVAADKRGNYETEEDYGHNAEGCGEHTVRL